MLVLPKADSEFAKLPIAGHPKILVTGGGSTRAESVLAGLRVAAARNGQLEAPIYVLVHDAARPCLTVEDIERLREEATDENGGLLAVPVTDTLKLEERTRARRTPGHANLWRAQSP